jgi:hypothetical protein
MSQNGLSLGGAVMLVMTSRHFIIGSRRFKKLQVIFTLKNSKIHTFVIEEIRRKLTQMEQIKWEIQLCKGQGSCRDLGK